MKIEEIISSLEKWAPTFLQEDYDNCGLLIGNKKTDCSGVLICLDVTEEIIADAISKKCNLIVAHHPIIFKGLKKINGKNLVENVVIQAIKNDISIYALHTNLDSIESGVNLKIAEKLGLKNAKILSPKNDILRKLVVFAPKSIAEKVQNAIFEAGAGRVGNYEECSFISTGMGSFKPMQNANPTIGEIGKREELDEQKLEFIFPVWLQNDVVQAMKNAHDYEEVAYDILSLNNDLQSVGFGMIGELDESLSTTDFLKLVSEKFDSPFLKHSKIVKDKVKKIAFCGGSGSFLTQNAIASEADVYLSSDRKYHEWFDAEERILLVDIGHYESEQFTIDLILEFLVKKFPNFAVLKTSVKTNPVHYFQG